MITIKGITKEETAFDKDIHFTYEGKEYRAQLHWDKFDGYDLSFTDLKRYTHFIDTPEWAVDWEENNDESLELTLDNLTDEVMVGNE